MGNTYQIYFITFYIREKMGWLGLGYLFSVLKKLEGISVKSLFYKTTDIDIAIEEMVKTKPDMIGISVLQAELLATKEFVKRIKLLLPDTHIVIGNKEATELPEIIMDWCPEVDSVVIGEGEETIVEMVERLKDGKTLMDCDGVYYRKGNHIVKNKLRSPIKDITSLPYPDREVTAPLIYNEYVRAFPVFTARGCKGRCSFCVANEHMVRTRSLDDVFNEISELIYKYNATYIIFGDSSFEDGGVTPLARYQELLDTIKKRKLNFRFRLSSRTETLTPEVISILKELMIYGLDSINLGIESGNDADLRIYCKIARLSDNNAALELLKNAKIPFDIYFIMFNPYSTAETLEKNIEFLYGHQLLYTFHLISSRFMAFSGASLTKKLFKDNLMKPGVTYPITDPFCYNFENIQVKKIWNIMTQINEIIDDSLKVQYTEFTDLMSLINWLIDDNSPYKNDASVNKLSMAFYDYTKIINEYIYTLFKIILVNLGLSETEILNKLCFELEIINFETEKAWNKVRNSKIMVNLKLKRHNALPIKNHIC